MLRVLGFELGELDANEILPGYGCEDRTHIIGKKAARDFISSRDVSRLQDVPVDVDPHLSAGDVFVHRGWIHRTSLVSDHVISLRAIVQDEHAHGVVGLALSLGMAQSL